MIVDPRGLTLTQYADAVTLSANSAWSLGRLDDESKWQDWATGLLRAAQLTAQNVPNPYFFTDWREWAMRAYPMLESLN